MEGNRNKLWIAVLFIITLTACTTAKKYTFYYTNPLMSLTFRDTHIVHDGTRYYAVGTCTPVWGGQNPGVKLFVSDDLVNWHFDHLLIDASRLDSNVWYRDRFWAPELHKFGNKYYLSFNCQNNSGNYGDVKAQKHFHACGLAIANNIMGPYTVVTPDEPLTSFASNDMTLFKDTNNKIYAFFNNGWADTLHIYVAELDTVKYRLKETPHQLLTQEPGTWDEAGIEGSHVVKKDGIYYLFYSSWTRGYAVGYATAKNIYGPWKKSPDNPLFGSFSRNDSTFVIRSGKVHYEPKCELLAIGHNQIFIGPDGNYWTSYHGNKKGFPEAVTLIDPIEFKNGKIYTPTPTYTPQKITYTAKSVLKNKKKIGAE